MSHGPVKEPSTSINGTHDCMALRSAGTVWTMVVPRRERTVRVVPVMTVRFVMPRRPLVVMGRLRVRGTGRQDKAEDRGEHEALLHGYLPGWHGDPNRRGTVMVPDGFGTRGCRRPSGRCRHSPSWPCHGSGQPSARTGRAASSAPWRRRDGRRLDRCRPWTRRRRTPIGRYRFRTSMTARVPVSRRRTARLATRSPDADVPPPLGCVGRCVRLPVRGRTRLDSILSPVRSTMAAADIAGADTGGGRMPGGQVRIMKRRHRSPTARGAPSARPTMRARLASISMRSRLAGCLPGRQAPMPRPGPDYVRSGSTDATRIASPGG